MRINRLVYLFVMLGLAGSAFASDGVLEINQTCAVQTGCFSGDAAGFPVTISTSGSYVMTGDLIGVAGQSGIAVLADDVDLDLNGFSLIGVSGTIDGISIEGGQTNITIRDGTVRDWGSRGVDLLEGSECAAVNLRAIGNASGFRVGTGSELRDCLAQGNLGVGVFVSGNNNVVAGCRVIGNGGAGVFLGATGGPGADGNAVVENVVASNLTEGIRINVGTRNRIDGNMVVNNVQGIRTSAGLTGNLFIRNMAGGNSSDDYGISGTGAGPVGTASSATSPWANLQY